MADHLHPSHRNMRNKATKSKQITAGILVTAIVLVASVTPLILMLPEGKQNLSARSRPGPDNGFDGPFYPTLQSLKQNSIIAELMSVQNLAGSYCDSHNGACSPDHFDFQVNVLSYVKGAGPSEIYITDVSYPIMTVVGEFFLFLQNDWTCPPSPPAAPCVLPPTPTSNTYYVLGGAQGKFVVQNGLVYSLKALYPSRYSWLGVDVNGLPVSQFLMEVGSA